MRLLFKQYPSIYVETTVLRKPMLPFIDMPSYFFGVGNNQFYEVDFEGNVSPVTGYVII